MRKIDNIDYGILSDIERQRLLDSIKHRRISLNSEINETLQSTDKPTLKKVYQQVKEMPDIDLKDLENKEWVWNNGHLRSQVEIDLYNRQLEQENYYKTTWLHDKNKPTALIYLPPLLWLGIIMGGFTSDSDISIIAFFTFPLSFLVSMIIYYIMNRNVASKAEKHGVPYSDEDYKKAVFEMKASKAAIISGAAAYTGITTSGLKETKNPDTWIKV